MSAATGSAEMKKAVVVTPLMQFLKEKHTVKPPEPRKAPVPRKGMASGRVRSKGSALPSIVEDGEVSAPVRTSAAKTGVKAKEKQVRLPVHVADMCSNRLPTHSQRSC